MLLTVCTTQICKYEVVGHCDPSQDQEGVSSFFVPGYIFYFWWTVVTESHSLHKRMLSFKELSWWWENAALHGRGGISAGEGGVVDAYCTVKERGSEGRRRKKLSAFFLVGGMLHGMWDLSSPARDQTHTPCIGRAESFQCVLPDHLDHQGSLKKNFYVQIFLTWPQNTNFISQ